MNICTVTSDMLESNAIEKTRAQKVLKHQSRANQQSRSDYLMAKNNSIPTTDPRQTSLFEIANSSFHIKRNHNNYLLQDEHFKLVDPETLIFVIQELSKTLQLLKQGHTSQQDLIDHSAWNAVKDIAARCKWYFPPQLDTARGLGSGVYFIKHPAIPNLIKIGMTASFRQRMRSIRDGIHREIHSPQKVELSVLAFASTHQYKQFENDLHHVFGAYRTRGEWFQEAPISDFILQCRERLS